MRKLAKVAALVAGVAVATTTMFSAGAFAASSITAPSSNPFVVPGNATGVPQAFTVSATGFAPSTAIYVEQCDGTPATAVGWDPAQNCDLGTSPSPVTSNASGAVSFPVANPNFRFTPFKGISPQGLFNCLSPTQAASNNGLPDFKNCQLRVSSNNTVSTSDQVFLTLTLPNAGTTPPPPTYKVQCGIKGNLVFGPGIVTKTPPTKAKPIKIKGDATGPSCTRAATAPVTKFPVSTATVKIKGALPTGSLCPVLNNPPFNGTLVQIKWQGINPKTNKLSTVGVDKAFVNASSVQPTPFGYTLTAPVSIGKVFVGRTVQVKLVIDETQAQLQARCAGGGVGIIGFNGNSSIIGAL